MLTVLLVVAAYLIGAIPFGLLLGLARGVDVRQHGSGNIGATNVGRVLGRGWGKLCLALDILKGLLPTGAAGLLLREGEPDVGLLLRWLAVGLAAVLGHVFPIYLRFRGGKGVATTIGVALGVYPYYTVAMAVALGAYAAARLTSGVVSAGSLALAIVFPASLYVYLWLAGCSLAQHWPLQAVAVLLGAIIIVRHIANVRRLLRGEEMRPTGTRPDRAAAANKSSPPTPTEASDR